VAHREQRRWLGAARISCRGKDLREHLATLLDDFREIDREIAVVRYQGNRRRVTTYGELARFAGRFAALLEDRGIGPGDRLLLWAENSAEWIASFYGCMLRGVMVVPLDAFGSADFAARVAADVRPKLAVGDAVLLGKLGPELSNPGDKDEYVARAGHPVLEFQTLAFEDWASSLPAREAGPVAGLSRETPLQILFTSGTTGDPKGIVHTHGNVLASVGPIEQGAQRYLRYEKYAHPLRFLHTLPLSHVFGQTMGLWIPPVFAAEVHFESRLVAPRLVETIKRERISVLAAVPRVMALLKTHLEASTPGLAERVAASQGMKAWKRWWVFRDVHRALGIKFWALISGGGALAAPLEQFWNALGFVVVQGYGMTETTALITLNHPFHVARGTIGKPLPGREVKLGPDGEVLVRGPMISNATWSGGELRQREDDWLATGDLAETQATGELRFMGRKSETIVTAAGVNVHPEDLEAALEEQPEINACAVVAMETASGPEPCAVLAVRGADGATAAVERANARLAKFQQVRRWMVWPEPDLPRTSTGKVRRKTVAEWVRERSTGAVESAKAGASAHLAGGDWLLSLVAEIAGERLPAGGDELRLSEDLHLDSLGRVQLAAALEERLADPPTEGAVDQARTLGDLRKLVSPGAGDPGPAVRDRGGDTPAARNGVFLPTQEREGVRDRESTSQSAQAISGAEALPGAETVRADHTQVRSHAVDAAEKPDYLYPRWPWWGVIQAVRVAFLEAIAQPLVRLLAKPKVVSPHAMGGEEPMLIICNHVTAYDGPLVLYALPGRMRRRVAAAMSGEMLEDFRHFRDPERGPAGQKRFMLFGPLAYWLLTALYNVFPLPNRRDFQRSFAHAGEALDRGYNVLVFPEGTRSAEGALARFRPGIGLLVKQSRTAVLPVAILGLGELKTRQRRWIRSGRIEVRVGEALRFGPEENEAAITARLHAEVEILMGGVRSQGSGT
jgi:long-chain acyl-CoA synthetase